MGFLNYNLDNEPCQIDVDGSVSWISGEDKCLSNQKSDPTYELSWYSEGVKCVDLFSDEEFQKIQNGIKKIIENKTNKQFEKLENYHLEVNHQLHQEVVSYTRNLKPTQFNFETEVIYKKLSEIVGFKLSDYCAPLNVFHSIIIRINRPNSLDYNPPHKDGYEILDYHGLEPNFINVWIPICGVSHKSSLPFAIGSHLIPENKIIRSEKGAIVSGKQYHVRCIKEWNLSNKLQRIPIQNKQAFLFSPFLIHGLALNQQEDQTRIALEFRLFKV